MPRFDVVMERQFLVTEFLAITPPLEVTITLKAPNEAIAAVLARTRFPLYAVRNVRPEARIAGSHPRIAGQALGTYVIRDGAGTVERFATQQAAVRRAQDNARFRGHSTSVYGPSGALVAVVQPQGGRLPAVQWFSAG